MCHVYLATPSGREEHIPSSSLSSHVDRNHCSQPIISSQQHFHIKRKLPLNIYGCAD